MPKAQFNLFTHFLMLLPSRAEATAAHRAALVIVINNVWLIWLIKQSGNPLPVGNTTSSRITKITSELSALVTLLPDQELDSCSRSKNTFMQCNCVSSVLVSLKMFEFKGRVLTESFQADYVAVKPKIKWLMPWQAQFTKSPRITRQPSRPSESCKATFYKGCETMKALSLFIFTASFIWLENWDSILASSNIIWHINGGCSVCDAFHPLYKYCTQYYLWFSNGARSPFYSLKVKITCWKIAFSHCTQSPLVHNPA